MPPSLPPGPSAAGAQDPALDTREAPAIVVGAGPAGLTAAYVLASRGVRVTVLEKDRQVGGIARTVEYKGFRFDIGGHRFFTKVRPVRELWRAMLGPDLLTRPRLSRIYYRGRFFDYPLRPLNALRGLGLVNAALVVLSYGWSQVRPIRPELSFEAWVSNRFGRRLYNIFFKTYTEKVWGLPCSEIGAQWAAQRIRGLSLRTAVLDMLLRRIRPRRPGRIKTLIDEFEYPRLGPGMMWEAFRTDIERKGATVRLGALTRRIAHRNGRVEAVEVATNGCLETIPVAALVSTMPLRELVGALSPAAPTAVSEAAARLHYRDFLTVALIVDEPHVFPDNWIYVHDPGVKLGRIQNFKNWSPAMVPDARRTCLGLEYFCFEDDELWSLPDRELVAVARRELGAIGLVDPAKVIDGTVVRMPKAYPVYDQGYEAALAVVRSYLDGFANLRVAGRNGMHKYNNQDHSMVTAMLAARHLLGKPGDAWGINADDDYHEEDAVDLDDLSEYLADLTTTQPLVPTTIGEAVAAGRTRA
jgi:protoporphyrinogen oxidase